MQLKLNFMTDANQATSAKGQPCWLSPPHPPTLPPAADRAKLAHLQQRKVCFYQKELKGRGLKSSEVSTNSLRWCQFAVIVEKTVCISQLQSI